MSSNLIKSNHIYFNHQSRRVIDSNSKMSVIEQEKALANQNRLAGQIMGERDETGFVEGLNPRPVEMIENEQYEVQEQERLEEANQKAEQIIADAIAKAENEKASVLNAAKEKGYRIGYEEGLEKIRILEQELESKKIQLLQEYEEKLKGIEPFYGELLIEYIRKLTGIAAEEHADVILYLIRQSISGSEQSNVCKIRVSKEDYPVVDAKRDEIESLLKQEVDFEIIEDSNLYKNDCIIETDNRVVDCSLQIQLENLITDLKILSRT